MPLYEYRCPDGHTETHLRRDKPATLPCARCARDATPIVSMTAPGLVSGSANPIRIVPESRAGYVEEAPGIWVKGTSIDADKIVDWRCTACGHADLAVDEPLPAECPKCAGVIEVYDNPKARHEDWFPKGGYYDQALGVHLESRAHRAQVLKERGLRESDDFEIEGKFRNAAAIRTQQDADINEMLDEWDDDKERARLIDEGRTPDHSWARDVMR